MAVPRDVALKTMVTNTEKYVSIFENLHRLIENNYGKEAGNPKGPAAYLAHHETIVTGMKRLAWAGDRELSDTKSVHMLTTKVDTITSCLRRLGSKFSLQYEKESPFVAYTEIQSDVCNALNALKKEVKFLAIFFTDVTEQVAIKTKKTTPSKPRQENLGTGSRDARQSNISPKCDRCVKYDKLHQQLQQTQEEYSKLRLETDNNNMEIAIKVSELEKELKIERDKQRYKTDLGSLQKKLLESHNGQLEKVKEEHHYHLQSRDRMIDQLQQQVEQLTANLAAEMSDRVSSDESSIENVAIKNRPMNIAGDYYNFCSNAWLDAKNTLDDKASVKEENALQFLNGVLEVASACTQETIDSFHTKIGEFVHCPRLTNDDHKHDKGKPEQSLPIQLTNMLGDYMRVNGEKANLSLLNQSITEELKRRKEFSILHKIIPEGNIATYISEATRIAWNMAIQRPIMEFKWDGCGKPWQEDTQEPYWRCDPYKKGALVAFYVHPALFHGNSLLVKGKVFIA